MYCVVCVHSNAYNWTVTCEVRWFPTSVNYRPISLPPLLMKNNYKIQRNKPYMVERKTRVGRSAVGFGGIDSRGDSCRHYIETKLCIWHDCVLSVS